MDNQWYIEDSKIAVTYDYYEMVDGTNVRVKTQRTSIVPCMVIDNQFCITEYDHVYPEGRSIKTYMVISQDSKTIKGIFYEDQKWYDVINAIYWQIEQAKGWFI